LNVRLYVLALGGVNPAGDVGGEAVERVERLADDGGLGVALGDEVFPSPLARDERPRRTFDVTRS
jgi:hypothetical protein